MVPMHLGVLNGLRLQERNPDILFFSLKRPRKRTPYQVSQQGTYGKSGPFAGNFAYLSKTSSFGFPDKGDSLKVPFMETLAERCPTMRAPLHSSTKVPVIPATPTPPPYIRFPSGAGNTFCGSEILMRRDPFILHHRGD